MKPFIGIKRLWYGNSMTAAPTVETLSSLISSMTEVKNSHDGTFQYSHDDPNITDYINELTGKPYYRDMTDEGNKTIAFTIGEYEFGTKADLQGGTVIKKGGSGADKDTVVGWSAPTTPEIRYKSIVGMTKTGNFVIFTNASLVGKVDTQEKNLGLGVTAVAMDNETSGVADEYWFDGSAINLAPKA